MIVPSDEISTNNLPDTFYATQAGINTIIVRNYPVTLRSFNNRSHAEAQRKTRKKKANLRHIYFSSLMSHFTMIFFIVKQF